MHDVYYEILNNIETVTGISNCIIRTYHTTDQKSGTTPHWHDAFEMALMLHGSGCYTCQGCKYNLNAGDLLFVDSGTIHQAVSDSHSLSLVAVISNQFLKEQFPDIQNMSFAITPGTPAYEKIKDHMYDIYHMLNRPNQDYIHLLIKAKLLNILYVMCAECRIEKSSHTNNEFHSKKVMQYVNEHYAESITLDIVAQVAGLQKNYFSRCFKKQTGMSFKHYLSRIRLDAALSLLSTSQFSMLDCALQAGFSGEKIMIDWCKKSIIQRLVNT